MTILPKKKVSQQKSEGDTSDSNAHSHSYHGDRHGHPTQDGRERFNYPSRNSPPRWLPNSSREDKRPAHSSSSNFDDYDGVDGGPSHSKRRHRASPHRSTRKSHGHSHGHSHRNAAPSSFTTPAGPSQSGHNPAQERPNNSAQANASEEDPSAYNSGDEYDRPVDMWTEEELEERERLFEKKLRKKGYAIKKMGEDGACLFRAVADQVYGDQEMHAAVRKLCMDYMVKNKDYFSQYVTEDFEKYVQRKRCDHIHGNHIEMQALSEMFNRPIEVYHYSSEPINIFHGMHQAENENEPIRLSYHRNVHYNSIVDPYKATVGVGLGLPAFKPGVADKSLIKDAIRASEELELEQAMLEDKLRATDWEATNEVIEEQVARESYLEWLRENEMRARKKSRSSTATSSSSLSCSEGTTGGLSPSCAGRSSPRTRNANSTCNSPKTDLLSEEKSLRSPDKALSPRAETSHASMGSHSQCSQNMYEGISCNALPSSTNSGYKEQEGFALIETASFLNQLPPSIFGLSDWEETDILAKVLAQSQQEYLESLKRSASGSKDTEQAPS